MFNEEIKDEKLKSRVFVGDGVYNRVEVGGWFRILFWVCLVVAVGMVAVNQSLEFYYKAEFLKAPCSLCLELNPEVSEQCFIREERLYPNTAGGWQYENGTTYEGYVPAPSLNLDAIKVIK